MNEKIIRILKKYGVKEAYLFGSRAEGKARKNSDFDFLVKFKSKKSIFDAVNLKRELQKVLKRKVDLVTEKGISPKILPQIKKVRIL